jgi:phosphoribosyl 1,2-cyclic phosphate phosphodiesterase
MSRLRITILGCGTSTGVPVVGCPCEVCQSGDPRNQRTRSSIVVSKDGQNLLVDTAPDLRQQALANHLTKIDAVLYTHDHADHIFGMDELRTFNFIMGRAIPVYGNAKVIARIQTVFNYIWDPNAPKGGGLPMITPHVLASPLELAGIRVEPLPLLHGEQTILGFKFDNCCAYLTDCNGAPPETLAAATDLPLVIIDGLRYRPHSTHYSVEEAVAVVRQLRPRRALLTHMSHSLDYNRLRAELPAGIEPAYDGQVIAMENI